MADDTFEKASSNGNIYYTACNSWGELCGRVVTEYVLLSQFFSDLGIEFGENDYLTMGPDYTIDPQYSDYNYGTAQENYSQYWKNYGWYNYNDLCGERSYYQNWKTAFCIWRIYLHVMPESRNVWQSILPTGQRRRGGA